MKRREFLKVCAVASISVLLPSCGSKKKKEELAASSAAASASASRAKAETERLEVINGIETYISENAPQEMNNFLASWSDRWWEPFMVTSSSVEKVDVSIYVGQDYFIPYVAESYLPIVKEAVEQSGYELDSFGVSWTDGKNKTWWTTKDCSVGTLYIIQSNEPSPSLNIDELKEYFSTPERDEICEKMMNGQTYKEVMAEMEDSADSAESVESEITKSETTYYWTDDGKVYHRSRSCSSLKKSKNVHSGTLSQAQSAGKNRSCTKCH